MSIVLTTETQRLIERRMDLGRFRSADDVVRAALETLDLTDPLAGLSSDQLDVLYPGFREQFARGLAEADAEQLIDGEAFFAELAAEDEASDAGPSRQPA